MTMITILLAILLVLVTLLWAGAARRAAMLTDHLDSARALLRLQEHALRDRAPQAEIIPFRRTPPDAA